MSGGHPVSGKSVTRPLRAYIFNLSCDSYIVNFHTQCKLALQVTPESENTH